MTNIQDDIKDLLDDYYKDECGLTDSEIKMIVDKSVYDQDLNLDVECAITHYIEEFLWDIGKPKLDDYAKTMADIKDFNDWLGDAPRTIQKISEYLDTECTSYDQETKMFLGDVLRGRTAGKFRDMREG